jgi:hypothetical protein
MKTALQIAVLVLVAGAINKFVVRRVWPRESK